MPWGTWTLGTQASLRLGIADFTSVLGLRLNGLDAPQLPSLLSSPLTQGLVEIKNNKLVAVGSAPDFPAVPKWRKVVRQIG